MEQINEDEVVAFYCPDSEVQYSVPYHHTIESNCHTPDIDEMISKASVHFKNSSLMKDLSKASISMPLLSVSLSMFRPYEIKRSKDFLCKEGIRFSTDGGVYVKGKRISVKHILGKTKDHEYVSSMAKNMTLTL